MQIFYILKLLCSIGLIILMCLKAGITYNAYPCSQNVLANNEFNVFKCMSISYDILNKTKLETHKSINVSIGKTYNVEKYKIQIIQLEGSDSILMIGYPLEKSISNRSPVYLVPKDAISVKKAQATGMVTLKINNPSEIKRISSKSLRQKILAALSKDSVLPRTSFPKVSLFIDYRDDGILIPSDLNEAEESNPPIKNTQATNSFGSTGSSSTVHSIHTTPNTTPLDSTPELSQNSSITPDDCYNCSNSHSWQSKYNRIGLKYNPLTDAVLEPELESVDLNAKGENSYEKAYNHKIYNKYLTFDFDESVNIHTPFIQAINNYNQIVNLKNTLVLYRPKKLAQVIDRNNKQLLKVDLEVPVILNIENNSSLVFVFVNKELFSKNSSATRDIHLDESSNHPFIPLQILLEHNSTNPNTNRYSFEIHTQFDKIDLPTDQISYLLNHWLLQIYNLYLDKVPINLYPKYKKIQLYQSFVNMGKQKDVANIIKSVKASRSIENLIDSMWKELNTSVFQYKGRSLDESSSIDNLVKITYVNREAFLIDIAPLYKEMNLTIPEIITDNDNNSDKKKCMGKVDAFNIINDSSSGAMRNLVPTCSDCLTNIYNQLALDPAIYMRLNLIYNIENTHGSFLSSVIYHQTFSEGMNRVKNYFNRHMIFIIQDFYYKHNYIYMKMCSEDLELVKNSTSWKQKLSLPIKKKYNSYLTRKRWVNELISTNLRLQLVGKMLDIKKERKHSIRIKDMLIKLTSTLPNNLDVPSANNLLSDFAADLKTEIATLYHETDMLVTSSSMTIKQYNGFSGLKSTLNNYSHLSNNSHGVSPISFIRKLRKVDDHIKVNAFVKEANILMELIERFETNLQNFYRFVNRSVFKALRYHYFSNTHCLQFNTQYDVIESVHKLLKEKKDVLIGISLLKNNVYKGVKPFHIMNEVYKAQKNILYILNQHVDIHLMHYHKEVAEYSESKQHRLHSILLSAIRYYENRMTTEKIASIRLKYVNREIKLYESVNAPSSLSKLDLDSMCSMYKSVNKIIRIHSLFEQFNADLRSDEYDIKEIITQKVKDITTTHLSCRANHQQMHKLPNYPKALFDSYHTLNPSTYLNNPNVINATDISASSDILTEIPDHDSNDITEQTIREKRAIKAMNIFDFLNEVALDSLNKSVNCNAYIKNRVMPRNISSKDNRNQYALNRIFTDFLLRMHEEENLSLSEFSERCSSDKYIIYNKIPKTFFSFISHLGMHAITHSSLIDDNLRNKVSPTLAVTLGSHLVLNGFNQGMIEFNVNTCKFFPSQYSFFRNSQIKNIRERVYLLFTSEFPTDIFNMVYHQMKLITPADSNNQMVSSRCPAAIYWFEFKDDFTYVDSTDMPDSKYMLACQSSIQPSSLDSNSNMYMVDWHILETLFSSTDIIETALYKETYNVAKSMWSVYSTDQTIGLLSCRKKQKDLFTQFQTRESKYITRSNSDILFKDLDQLQGLLNSIQSILASLASSSSINITDLYDFDISIFSNTTLDQCLAHLEDAQLNIDTLALEAIARFKRLIANITACKNTQGALSIKFIKVH
ncbi:hypothetical protein NEOKW01_2006 [Nematocida sp. AWRm80]|nr:hypothetical protein NEOKW01_2006 [Nematocida sp. AWRm80]